MNKDKNKMSFEAGIARSVRGAEPPLELESLGVTAAEVEAADKLLASIADECDREVDYSGMLRRIKAEAMEKGLASQLAKKPEKKAKDTRGRINRIIRIAASAAAAFVLGLGVLGVIHALNNAPGTKPANDANDHQAYVSAEPTAQPADNDLRSEPIATRGADAVQQTTVPMATEVYVMPTEEVYATPDTTPLPSEFAVRGGLKGYTYIKGFETPETSEELIPPAMPHYMVTEPAKEGLGFTAAGKDEFGSACYITCKLVDSDEYDLPEGVAIYTLHDDGRVGYVWRVNENSLMYIDFEGFEYSEAEMLLLSYTMPDLAKEMNN